LTEVEKIKFNNTTGFVLPILFKDDTFNNLIKKLVGITLFDYLLINGFRNAYLNDYNYPMDGCIYCVFKPQEFTDKFRQLTEILEQHSLYKSTYDIEGGVVFIFNISDVFKKDIELIKDGKYSKTSPEYKRLFPQTVRDKKGNKVLFSNWMILHKHPQFKKRMEEYVGQSIEDDAELWDPFNPKYEVLNYNQEHLDISW